MIVTPEQFLRELQDLLIPDEFRLINLVIDNNRIIMHSQKRICKLVFEICYTWECIDSIKYITAVYSKNRATLNIELVK